MALVIAEGAAAPLSLWNEASRFEGVEQLLSSGMNPEAIVLSPVDEAQALRWLLALRRDAHLGLKPALLAHSFGERADALSNGLLGSPEQLLHSALALAQRQRELRRPEPLDADERLLTFLYLYPDYRLRPTADWRDERVYRYPLADAFANEREEGFQLLERLRQRSLLEPASLVDKLHVCPECHSAHLLFTDLCPQCGSMDIGEQNFLHCYACGNVSPQQDYMARDGLVCPKCQARLRHIGVDYDRALETLSCRGCASRFAEPEVKARCLRCHKLFASDALLERRYYELKLTAGGQYAARAGSTGDLLRLIDDLSQAHPAYFAQTLDWQLALSRRYRDLHFGLLCLKFANLQALTAELPRTRVAQMFDALAQRLRELVRGTDLVMRDQDEYCWLLLPQTAAEGLEVLRTRIAELSDASRQEDGRQIEIAVAAVTSAELAERQVDAALLMSELRGRLS